MASKAVDGARRLNPWRIIGWGGAGAVLLLPLVLRAPWTLSDYVFAGAVFAILGGTFELAARRSGSKWYRAGVAVALGTTFLLIWINGAVGMIGDEDNPANLMFLVVILIAIAGAIGARFEARGMARAMIVAAAAQMLVMLIVIANRLGAAEPPFYPALPLMLTGFALPWLLSAWLFARAART